MQDRTASEETTTTSTELDIGEKSRRRKPEHPADVEQEGGDAEHHSAERRPHHRQRRAPNPCIERPAPKGLSWYGHMPKYSLERCGSN